MAKTAIKAIMKIPRIQFLFALFEFGLVSDWKKESLIIRVVVCNKKVQMGWSSIAKHRINVKNRMLYLIFLKKGTYPKHALCLWDWKRLLVLAFVKRMKKWDETYVYMYIKRGNQPTRISKFYTVFIRFLGETPSEVINFLQSGEESLKKLWQTLSACEFKSAVITCQWIYSARDSGQNFGLRNTLT